MHIFQPAESSDTALENKCEMITEPAVDSSAGAEIMLGVPISALD
jgi:hypothetical protein